MGSNTRHMRRLLDFKMHACTYEQAKAMVEDMQGHASSLPQHHQTNLRKVADALEDLISIAAGSVPAHRASHNENGGLHQADLDVLDSPAGGMAKSAPAGLAGADTQGTLNQDVNPPAPATTAATKHKSKQKQQEGTEVATPALASSHGGQAAGKDKGKQGKEDGDKKTKRKRDEGPPKDVHAVQEGGQKEKGKEGERRKSEKSRSGKSDGGEKGKGEQDRRDNGNKDGKASGKKDGEDKGDKSGAKPEKSSKGQPQQGEGVVAAPKKLKKSRA